MAVKNFKKKTTAKNAAKRARKKGLKASVFKKKRGFGLSTTRKKK